MMMCQNDNLYSRKEQMRILNRLPIDNDMKKKIYKIAVQNHKIKKNFEKILDEIKNKDEDYKDEEN